ncbi:hypothetical protein EMIHUDRAFT_434125 [Emiliania huxleyi CCMP1516]|uniref:Uncharacterized protein n=2 Tax=Emiliania huxleyi TaxID=2903 RepID=A0A0D3KBW2_EMIH1|nr:hypothetical protein EMIHUDRAFT_434125 [Emiliania huxleyi CCMP1516]EOD33247.1 hypothetical protein EMIHUDRAFT_434125 [Emiliania huxleyi CCMP1516]|eukprot:XP_005785676.1 hypothetical protein EMIHUDRAFT_434125 [Emiliania huxleyi CCMP1516]
MTELKEHQLSEMQAAHSRVLEAKREEATKQLREVKIEVREAKLEAGRQIREAEMKARDSIHEAQAEAARQMDEVAEEKRATEAERESVRVQLSREQREMRAAVEAELRKHEMENAKLHEELGRAHVVCRAAVQFAQVVETFRTNSPASAFPLAGVAENFRASSPHDTPNRLPDSRAAGKDDALQPPTPPQHVRVPARPVLPPPAALPAAVGDKKKGGEAAGTQPVTRPAGASPSLSQVTELSNDMV